MPTGKMNPDKNQPMEGKPKPKPKAKLKAKIKNKPLAKEEAGPPGQAVQEVDFYEPKSKLKPKLKSKLKPKTEPEDYDPFTLPKPGYNKELKAHKTPKPKPKPPKPTPYLAADMPDWHVSATNSIPDDDSFCDEPEEHVAELEQPLHLTKPSSVVLNLYKPTELERKSFMEMMKDEVYYMVENGMKIAKNQLNTPKVVMKQIKQVRNDLKPNWESSIYVRGSESSLASYQFVIAGPRDTPYDNGLFLYQMLIPSDYPNVPPQILILTTGGGRYRINPNLYSGGKVCINLLGTFGNVWTNGCTIVQVLLAIQAQIMNETPLSNEPGYNQVKDGVENLFYNALQRIITMKLGMIEPMIKPYPGFNDMICKYFFGPKRMEIIQQMYTWVEAVEKITIMDCKAFLSSYAYNYISGAGDGAGGGIGLLPVQKMKPEQLQHGLIMMTKSHASKVLSLLHADRPKIWSMPKPELGLGPEPGPGPGDLVAQLMAVLPDQTYESAQFALEAASGNLELAIMLAQQF